jgi:uncharacterized protein YlaI
MTCTRCDGKKVLSTREWHKKGFPNTPTSGCELCNQTGFLPNQARPQQSGKKVCTRCDGKILLTTQEWAAKGFPGVVESKCQLCSETGFLDSDNSLTDKL